MWYHVEENVATTTIEADSPEDCIDEAKALGMNVVSTGVENRFNGDGITCFVAEDICEDDLTAM